MVTISQIRQEIHELLNKYGVKLEIANGNESTYILVKEIETHVDQWAQSTALY